MPEKENEEKKTSEESESKETKEETKEEDKKTEEKPSEEEEKKEDEKSEEEEKKEKPVDEEPKKRFPKQTTEDKKLGYEFRQWKKKKEAGELEDDDDFEGEEDDKPVTRKELRSLLDKSDKKSVSETMLQTFLSENPDFRKYEKTMRKYVNDDDYSNVPIGFIASGLVGEHLDDEANTRADLKIKADKEADKTKSGGSSKRTVPGKKKGIWDMSKDEFEEYQTDILHKSRE